MKFEKVFIAKAWGEKQMHKDEQRKAPKHQLQLSDFNQPRSDSLCILNTPMNIHMHAHGPVTEGYGYRAFIVHHWPQLSVSAPGFIMDGKAVSGRGMREFLDKSQ